MVRNLGTNVPKLLPIPGKNFPFNITNPMTKKRSCRLLFDLKYKPFELGVYFWATSIANLSRSAPFGNAIADSRE